MGGILMALAWGFILGAVLAPRYVIPWVRWRWPHLARAVFGAGILAACVTTPAPAQAPLTANAFPAVGAIGTGLPWRWRGGQVVSDPATGTALQFAYPAGKVGGTAPGNVYVDGPALTAANAQSVTFTGRLWVSPNWQGHLTTTNKTLFLGFGAGGNQVILNLRGKGAGPLYPSLYFQGMTVLPGAASCGAGGCGGQWAGRTPFTRGIWHDVALTITRTTASLTVDGQLVATRTGLQFTQGAFYLAKVALNPTWGGGGDRVIALMQMRWADVRVVAP